jgi:hypothetical protein
MAALSPGLAAAGGGLAPVVISHLEIHAAPGMDTQALARKVARSIARTQASRARARLWDDR